MDLHTARSASLTRKRGGTVRETTGVDIVTGIIQVFVVTAHRFMGVEAHQSAGHVYQMPRFAPSWKIPHSLAVYPPRPIPPL